MARTDIAYDMYRNDLKISSLPIACDFEAQWDGNVLVFPVELKKNVVYGVRIPYNGSTETVAAKSFTDCYFSVEGKSIKLKCCQLPIVSIDVFAAYVTDDNCLYLSSSFVVDLVVNKAKSQNALMNLLCIPGSYHRYPTSGVGLHKYLHGTKLASNIGYKVKEEFANDGVTVLDLQYSQTTGEFNIQTIENKE